MKLKLITIITFLFLALGSAKAQYVNLPDSNFRNSLRSKWPGAFNVSGQMDTSYFQIITLNQLVIINANIKDITGVKYFKSITSLLCSGNKLTAFPELPPMLNSIYCDNNQFTSIPNLRSSVILLSIYNNQITRVNSLPNTLKYLVVNNNPITIIDSLPNQLISLSCSNTSLRSLPTLPNTLEQLVCATNKITVLPALPATLTELTCTEDSLVSLPTLPASLIYLYCAKNFLQNLPALPNKLTVLKCQENKLTSLPALPQKLMDLSCEYNQLPTLPILSDSLKSLSCYNNALTSLPALPNKLQSLYCSNNLLDSLSALPALLETIECHSNKIDTLPLLPASLNYLDCSQNRLLALPALPSLLKYFYTGNNFITNLPALPRPLRVLNCSTNQITSLVNLPDSLGDLYVSGNANLICLPYLPKLLNNLDYTGTGIACVPNKPSACLFTPANPDVCVASNNVNQCHSFPQIFGLVYNDNNGNSIFDIGDVPKQNIKVKLNNGDFAITNNKGYYNISADTIGSYRTDVEIPPFYSPVPFSNIHLFSSYSNIVYDTFALQPTGIKDSLSIHVVPVQQKGRPGFAFAYAVKCENVGTTVLNTEIQMKYDTSRLVYDSASVTDVISNPTTLILSVAGMKPAQVQAFTAYFHLKSNAIIGDTLKADAVAKALAVSSYDTTTSSISGSYDPNSKQGTPVITPAQIAAGGFIDYIIHFQNTGNDTAFNIVIVDSLSPKLRTTFLQLFSVSHSCTTTLYSTYITFEFKNINLPDSGTNQNGSKGFIHFRIKPDSLVALGDSISNNASIYFDFNTPFVTNTCQTHIKATVLPLNLLSFTAKMQNNKRVLNEWATANEVNISHFNIQRSFNGKDFENIGKVNGKGSNQRNIYQYSDDAILISSLKVTGKTLYYRLEIWDKDGKKTYSPVQAVSFNTSGGYTAYPNPAHNVVTVEGNNMSKIKIADNTGRIILSKDAMNERTVELSISSIPKGLYILQVINTNGDKKSELLLVK